jgi:GTP-binding protein Era
MQPSPAPAFKSGFVAIAGRPNVGKSTLINHLLDQPVAAVSPRPQTTRKRQLGILTAPEAQIIFVDTPGIHRPVHKLGEAMNRQAEEALRDADLILFLVEANNTPTAEDTLVAQYILGLGSESVQKTILVLNKLDLVQPDQLTNRLLIYRDLLPGANQVTLSALQGQGVSELLALIIERLPEGPLYYPEEQVTDAYEREITADLIRAAALIKVRDEVPHGIAVRIDEYTERGAKGAYIAATLFVERETHKSIVIGKAGKMIKEIGAMARQEIETMSGRKVFLELRVKVKSGWRDDENALKQFGFQNQE